jgi:hypothetical protein
MTTKLVQSVIYKFMDVPIFPKSRILAAAPIFEPRFGSKAKESQPTGRWIATTKAHRD